jgi:hypothetical protein
MDLRVRFGSAPPEWSTVRERLASRGLVVQMRMIDGQLAFPDEEPTTDWRELRVASGGGMVTLRRGAAEIACVVWGNADESTRRFWRALAWAFAAAGAGVVADEQGPVALESLLAD